MPAKKNSVSTPLHLLEQLSRSLIEHLDKACDRALKDAESALAKLHKQRGKAQEKLLKARVRLDEAGSAGKLRAQGKARARLDELEESLALLQARQSETLNYLAELKRDAQQSRELAGGIGAVADAAAQALGDRQAAARQPVAAARPRTAKSARPAPVASAPAPAASKPATAGGTASAPASKAPARPSAARPRPAAKPGAKPAAKAASTPKPATRRAPPKGQAPASSE